jgi:tetratricopeptide (TPR) repeat protein
MRGTALRLRRAAIRRCSGGLPELPFGGPLFLNSELQPAIKIMTKFKLLPLVALASVAVAGCGTSGARDGRRGALTADEARAICLSEPHNDSPIDQTMRDHQSRARKLADKPDEWILVGKGWVRKARRSADPGFYVNVEACAEAALDLDPKNTAALELRSLALMNDHRFAEARDVAQTILVKEANHTVALGTLSDALLELGDFEESASAAQRMVDTRPDMASYSRASYMRWLQGDRAGAKLFIRYALNGRDGRDPEPTAWTLAQAATLYWNEGDYEGADAVFAESLNWLPNYPVALAGRGRVALSRNQPKSAVEFLEKAYRINPLAETAWLLGDAREMLGDTNGAGSEYDRVIQEGSRTDRLTLALFYATKNRDHDEALRLIEEERRVRGGIYVEDAYAWTLFRAGKISQARAASQRALRLGTPDARLLYHAGAIQLAAGDHKGLELVRKALVLNPRFDLTGAAEATSLVGSYEKKNDTP